MSNPLASFASRWERTWRQLGATCPDGELERLLSAWSGPQRHYHTLQHLEECLDLLEPARADAPHPAEVEAAVWYHDAVYDPRRGDNEALSADWARRSLLAGGAPADAAERVAGLVLATAHEAAPQGPDAALLVDVDLAILGAPAARFDEYDGQVRAEYAWVEAEDYRRARKRVLEGFLARGSIYSTPRFRAEREAMARSNLMRALARL
jgi:predicted metal-dependent HD superfamily phosphohydrolase